LDYFAERMGRQWIANEMQNGATGHPLGQWASEMRDPSRTTVAPGIITNSKVNNAFRSILSAAYSLYLIEHHYEQYDEPLFERLLNRLRVSGGFYATLSETNAAASFLKAGFFLKYEDDLRAGHHAEFTATYPQTGRRFSVEVKTRTGPLNDDLNLKDQIKLKNKLSQALKKNLPWTRVVFINLNIPDIITDVESSMLDELLSEVEFAERTLRIRGAPAPSAYLFLTNQPFHYNLRSIEGAPMIGALGFRMETFQPRRAVTFRQVILGREMHPEMHALIGSMKIHSEPPSTFDGQAPEFAFTETPHPRWIVGNQYLVPGPEGDEVLAQLQNATAVVETRTMHGVFRAHGVHFIVTAPMTNVEIKVYQRSPETFFGIVQSVGQQANTPLELAEFFYETYSRSSKETLLDFLKEHPDLDLCVPKIRFCNIDGEGHQGQVVR
jgi:hypothetical protein